jgi:hypothetical protein
MKQVASRSAWLFFDPEDEGDMFLRNVSWLSTDYTALLPRPLWEPQILKSKLILWEPQRDTVGLYGGVEGAYPGGLCHFVNKTGKPISTSMHYVIQCYSDKGVEPHALFVS